MEYQVKEGSTKAQQKLLFDKDYLGLGFNEHESDNPGLLVYDPYKDKILRYEPDDGQGYVTSWDWSPDGKLVISKGNSILIANSIDDAFSTLFTAEEGSYPKQVDVSPDGKSIAFSLPGNGFSHIYTIEVDGTGLHQLTSTDPSSSHPYDRFPSWSPRGDYLSIVTGESLSGCGSSSSCWGKCVDLFIIPADAENVDLSKADVWPAFKVMKKSEFSDGYVALSVKVVVT